MWVHNPSLNSGYMVPLRSTQIFASLRSAKTSYSHGTLSAIPIFLAVLLIIWYFVCMTFEWDENKNKQNTKKHNISFEEAQYAFLDPKKIILEDKKHSIDEERFFCIGQIGSGIVTVRFTIRNNVIRLFGAGYWREGKQRYEERC